MRDEGARSGKRPVALLVAGARASGEGYPNAGNTLRILQTHGVAEVVDLGSELPQSLHLWRLRRGGAVVASIKLAWIFCLNVVSLARILLRNKSRPLVYVPYPSMFLLWIASWLPAQRRPRFIADAFISVWDAMYRDRSTGRERSAASRLVHSIEQRALRAATLVLVDTDANARVLTDEFSLTNVRSLPLAVDESPFLSVAVAQQRSRPVCVLFVGTLVPLHGIEVLVAAIRSLGNEPDITFKVVGDGQMSAELEALTADMPPGRIAWERDWCSTARVAAEIEAADICVGVFGGPGKAARVLPFKLYLYLAAGRPVVSQKALSTPAGVPQPPIVELQSATPAALAQAILDLARDGQRRAHIGAEARSYYERWLANRCVAAAWSGILDQLEADEVR